MLIHHTVAGLQEALKKNLQNTEQERHFHRVVLVPTMGNLHAGHLQLVKEARKYGSLVVVSIFVNPMQFGRHEDLDAYPRTLEADCEQLREASCDHLFAPSPAEIYPHGHANQTVVSVPELTERHCGASRPGHFDGVSTVVSKLFNIVRPDAAIFGLKDYQQFSVIRKMISDLNYPIQLVGVETWREPGGLAMSSRNGYLTVQQRETAATLYQCLQQIRSAILAGEQRFTRLEANARQAIVDAGMRPDYVAIANASTLEPASPEDSELVVLLAAFCGKTRLIDNIHVTRPQSSGPEQERDEQIK